MIDSIKETAEKIGFYEKLNNAEKEIILKNSALVKYEKGQNVHSGNDECIGVMYIIKGALRIYIISDEGKEVTLYRLSDGETCVMSASCLLQSITFDVIIDAEEDTETLLINSQVLKKIMKENVLIENYVLNETVERFSSVMWTMQQILFMSMDKRLAIFLFDEIIKSGNNTVKMTHEQIAGYIGSAREVVSRMLKYFSEEGIVSVSRNGIEILDKKKLQKLTA